MVRWICFATLALLLCMSSNDKAHAGSISLTANGFYNSGFDGTNKIATNAFDTNWTGKRVAASGAWDEGNATATGGYNVGDTFNVAPVTVPTSGLPWLVDGASSVSRWVTPSAFRDGSGQAFVPSNPGAAHNASWWEYSLNVNNPMLAGNQLIITGRWASDNDVYLFINGVDTGVKRERTGSGSTLVRTFDSLANFSIPTQFWVPGANVVTFQVRNGIPGDTGFGKDGQSATGFRVEFLTGSVEPVPEPSMMLVCGGLTFSGFVARRRNRGSMPC